MSDQRHLLQTILNVKESVCRQMFAVLCRCLPFFVRLCGWNSELGSVLDYEFDRAERQADRQTTRFSRSHQLKDETDARAAATRHLYLRAWVSPLLILHHRIINPHPLHHPMEATASATKQPPPPFQHVLFPSIQKTRCLPHSPGGRIGHPPPQWGSHPRPDNNYNNSTHNDNQHHHHHHSGEEALINPPSGTKECLIGMTSSRSDEPDNRISGWDRINGGINPQVVTASGAMMMMTTKEGFLQQDTVQRCEIRRNTGNDSVTGKGVSSPLKPLENISPNRFEPPSIDSPFLKLEFFAGLERSAARSRRWKRLKWNWKEDLSSPFSSEDKENSPLPFPRRELFRTSTARSSLLTSPDDEYVTEASRLRGHVCVRDDVSRDDVNRNDVNCNDVIESRFSSPKKGIGFGKYLSSIAGRKRKMADNGKSGLDAKRHLRRSQAHLNLRTETEAPERAECSPLEKGHSTPLGRRISSAFTRSAPTIVFKSIRQMASRKTRRSIRQVISKTHQLDRSSINGKVHLSLNIQGSFLTVNVLQVRYNVPCDSYVEVSLVPFTACGLPNRTRIVRNSRQPLFNQKFSFELSMQDVTSQLVVTTWQKSVIHTDRNIGSIAFSIFQYLNDKVSSGWFELKHSISPANAVISRNPVLTNTILVTMHQAKTGYGFVIASGDFVTVSEVNPGGPAQRAGLRVGDVIARVNGDDVRDRDVNSVAEIVRRSRNGKISLEVIRLQYRL